MGKYALLIGVDTYGDGLQPLPAASKDVAALREVLLNPQMGGFDEAKPLINPTQPEMAEAIELWFQDRHPEDLVLLFFSGHGVKDDRRDLYFAAANTKKHRDRLLTSTATSARFIHDRIRACKAKYQVLILDCCFGGAFGELVARDSGGIPLKEQLGAEGRVVLTSTSAVDYSFEEKGADLSIYTRYLVEGIATGAADEDGDGVITIDELHRYAGRKVKETSPTMSPTLITLKDEGFRIRVARSPQDDPKLKYRKEAERRATTAEFTIPAKRLLVALRAELGVAEAEAEEIEAEVLKPHREYQFKQQEYQETLRQCLEEGAPLNQPLINDLRDYREHLRLKPEDVATIERAALNGYDLEGYVAVERQAEARRQQEEQAEVERQRLYAAVNQQKQPEHPSDQPQVNNFQFFQHADYDYSRDYQQAERNYVQGNYKDAAAVIDHLAERYPEDPSVLLLRGHIYCYGLQQYDLARQSYKAVLSLTSDPEYVDYATNALKYVNLFGPGDQITDSHQSSDTSTVQNALLTSETSDRDDLNSEKGIDYTRLRALLKAGNWRDADKETYEVMICAVGKKSGDWFTSEELLNFPCTDLRTIDGLWVKYSQGKFGFSVQKKIYVECGAQLDGKDSGDEIWHKFCERVGWRKDGKWLSRFDLQANPSFSPAGEFIWLLGGHWFGVGGEFFSRAEICEL
ncbi:caspase, EACC1-associated type [Nodosilinea sp. E11]|uniref:caspase, EACC1-associated type n=1 Tax=Nodosilinea sp. E11 TaxID=3037479 RepID=UPI0029352A2A|nr:GUN4 domain-containing protein [Nodosilinea sp. E11]WOD39539.1 GUN4 domain-containing protein [Nodosilinea sp. E11]